MECSLFAEFIPKSFVEEMLPPLLHNLARFPVAISAYALSMNSLGKYLINSIAAERQVCDGNGFRIDYCTVVQQAVASQRA